MDNLYNELLLKTQEIIDKLESRQKVEQELGIPTSDELTNQFIEQEVDEATKKYVNKKVMDMIDEHMKTVMNR